MLVRVDSFIRVREAEVPPHVLPSLLGALQIANPSKPTALRELVWGAERLPDQIPLYLRDGRDLLLPRGFLHQFSQGMAQWGMTIEWEDCRRFYEFWPLNLDPVPMRDYQEPAVQALVTCEQGIYEAPTAAGKTAVALEALRRVDQPTIIIVDKAALARQWVEQIKEKLGYDAGYLGESEINLRPITVALRQAIWARYNELERMAVDLHTIHRRFFDIWGSVIVDECHHTSAETLQDILQRFPARYRWGVSATPDRDPLFFPIVQAIIGPIVHETTAEEAGDSLVTPSVRVLTSDFEFDYHSTQKVERLDGDGEVVISRRTGRPIMDVVRNNYNAMMSALCSDSARNEMIAEEVIGEMTGGHRILVISRRKMHLKAIYETIKGLHAEAAASTIMLTGESSGKEAVEVRELISDSPYICVLSTIAEEGFDAPMLDRVVLAYPFRNVEVVKQPVGRIMRPAPGKKNAVVIDVRDPKVDLLASQYRTRIHMLYNQKGWKVEIAERTVV
jgi:superfamily II DNA or RNA helicase